VARKDDARAVEGSAVEAQELARGQGGAGPALHLAEPVLGKAGSELDVGAEDEDELTAAPPDRRVAQDGLGARAKAVVGCRSPARLGMALFSAAEEDGVRVGVDHDDDLRCRGLGLHAGEAALEVPVGPVVDDAHGVRREIRRSRAVR